MTKTHAAATCEISQTRFLPSLLEGLELTQRAFAKGSGMSVPAVSRLVTTGQWPARSTSTFKTQAREFLMDRGATQEQLQAVFEPANKLAPVCSQHTEAAPETDFNATPEEEPMLLQNESLSQKARKHFNLPRNPFLDDVQTPDDVFQTPSVRYARVALTDCARHHGFMGLVAESGAGKSTLAEDLEERVRKESTEIVVIRPYVLAMEENDIKGKTLKSSSIAESIIFALDPHAKPKISSQARFRQAHELLRASAQSGHRHLLLIEEAHNLPVATLKHLKRWIELKDGMRRLLGIALIGQPELRRRLSAQNPEVREVAQRCELVELEPLNKDLEGYLKHKFARFDLKYEDVFAADAADAIRSRLIYLPRGGKEADITSICYPLVVNNLVCRAMNAAAEAGWDTVNAQVIKGC